jgi:hypothetical protein
MRCSTDGTHSTFILRGIDEFFMRYHFHLDDMGFLRDFDGKILIWVPQHLRGEQVVSFASGVVIGGDSGAMTFVHD